MNICQRICIDLDGVMADFTSPFTQEAARLGIIPAPFPASEQEHWKFAWDTQPVWYSLDRTRNWWMTLPPLVQPHEVKMLNEVALLNAVFFITNRTKGYGFDVKKQSELWLESIGINPRHVVVATTDDKAATAREFEIDLAIDDKPQNVVALRQAGIKTVVRRWAYNEGVPGPEVTSVGQFIKEHVWQS